jgi:hypothetical protein
VVDSEHEALSEPEGETEVVTEGLSGEGEGEREPVTEPLSLLEGVTLGANDSLAVSLGESDGLGDVVASIEGEGDSLEPTSGDVGVSVTDLEGVIDLDVVGEAG